MPPTHDEPAEEKKKKKKEGTAAKYITRTKAIKYLQVSPTTFRKLCILKGIRPRVPKKKFEGNHETYYSMKDIIFLAHEPLLKKSRISFSAKVENRFRDLTLGS